jgi:hypothetical protein
MALNNVIVRRMSHINGYIIIYIYKIYCHVSQWQRRRFGFVNQFIGSSLVVTKISSYTLKITVTIAHVTSHSKSPNSSSGHPALPLELRNSSEVNSDIHILSENTILLLRRADHTENKSRDNYFANPLARWLLPSNELWIFVLSLRARITGCLSSRCLAMCWHVTICKVNCRRIDIESMRNYK